MTKALHKKWLNVTALVIAAFGPIFFLGTMLETKFLSTLTMDFLSFPVDGSYTGEDKDTQFLSAITGGFLFGWGMMIYFLKIWVFDASPEGVRKAVLFGLFSWFLLDSSGSIASGNWQNAVINIFVLLLAAGPLFFKATDL